MVATGLLRDASPGAIAGSPASQGIAADLGEKLDLMPCNQVFSAQRFRDALQRRRNVLSRLNLDRLPQDRLGLETHGVSGGIAGAVPS